jgi:hypothetical protein
MTDTERLIEQLAARAAPVKRLPSPLLRTTLWMLLAAVVAAIIVASQGLRGDLAQAVASPGAVIEWSGSLLTGVFAAYAAFQVSVPGRSPSWAWLPLPAALLWMTGLCVGCIEDLARMGLQAFAFQHHSAECAWAITFTSLPLGLVMLVMVRHAGVVRPGPTALLAALSAAAVSAAAVSLIHEGESALMGLVWHVGAVAVLSGLSWLFGHRLFAWIGYARR